MSEQSYSKKAESLETTALTETTSSASRVALRQALSGQAPGVQFQMVRPQRPMQMVQMHGGETSNEAVHQVASEGMSGGARSLPHLDAIQHSFGRHDVSGVQAHVGGAAHTANARLGSVGYASGNSVAFKQDPDLHLAAHEAAHVVQQRSGSVQLKGGVGQAGDRYEQHADAVADAVVQGKSAEHLLDPFASPQAVQCKAKSTVQRKEPSSGENEADKAKKDTASAVGEELTMLVVKSVLGNATQEERDAVAERIRNLPNDEFVKLFKSLQKADSDAIKTLFTLLGDDNANAVAEKMSVEFEVPQILFDGVDQSHVNHQVQVANTIYGRYGMTIKAPVTKLPKEVEKSIFGVAFKANVSEMALGNDKGEINEADIDSAGEQTMAVLKTFHPGGKLAAFWFNDIVENDAKYGAGRTLHGQALAARTNKKYKGKESVFCWEGSNADTLAHEMGHVLWGQKGHHDDNKNLMASGSDADTLAPGANPTDSQFVLDEQQIRMFKAGIYAKIKKAKTKSP